MSEVALAFGQQIPIVQSSPRGSVTTIPGGKSENSSRFLREKIKVVRQSGTGSIKSSGCRRSNRPLPLLFTHAIQHEGVWPKLPSPQRCCMAASAPSYSATHSLCSFIADQSRSRSSRYVAIKSASLAAENIASGSFLSTLIQCFV